MGIYIKGMEMPQSCFYCPFREKVNPDDFVCMALNKEYEETFSLIAGSRHEDCPLVPVPPHGDLIDRDVLIQSKEIDSFGAVFAVAKAPTVIPETRKNKRGRIAWVRDGVCFECAAQKRPQKEET